MNSPLQHAILAGLPESTARLMTARAQAARAEAQQNAVLGSIGKIISLGMLAGVAIAAIEHHDDKATDTRMAYVAVVSETDRACNQPAMVTPEVDDGSAPSVLSMK